MVFKPRNLFAMLVIVAGASGGGQSNLFGSGATTYSSKPDGREPRLLPRFAFKTTPQST